MNCDAVGLSSLPKFVLACFCLSPLANAATESPGAEVIPKHDQKELEMGDLAAGDPTFDRVRDALKGSLIGQMFTEYLSVDADPVEINQRAHALVNRVYNDAPLIMLRESAVGILKQDAFISNAYDRVRLAERMSVLNSALDSKRQRREYHTEAAVSERWAFFVPTALIWGSPLVRTQVRVASRLFKYRAYSLVSRDRYADRLRFQRQRLDLKSLFTTKVFDDYQPIAAGRMFWATYISSYATGMFAIGSGSVQNAPVPARVAVYALQRYGPLDSL